MDFLDVVEVAADGSYGFKGSPKPKIFVLFNVLLLIGIVWGLIEFFSVKTLLLLCV